MDVSLDRFHVLIGPNASGKSTLFDAIAFLGDLVRGGLEGAVRSRTSNFQDLVWGRPASDVGFELAIEFDVPDELQEQFPADKDCGVCRYEAGIGEDRGGGARIRSERGLLMPHPERKQTVQRTLFPDPADAPPTILIGGGRLGMRTVLSKSRWPPL